MRAAAIFDLDGTLIDSTGDIAAAANHVREINGLSPLPEAGVAAHIGWGLGHLLTHTLPGIEGAGLAAARAAFIEFYGAHCLVKTQPYPGADALLSALAEAGVALGLVTNKPGMFLDPILDGLGWRERFGAVLGGDALPQRKPDPAPLVAAMARLGVEAAETIYVGDTEVDAETARRASVDFVAVPWGRVVGAGPADTGSEAQTFEVLTFEALTFEALAARILAR